MECQLPEAIWIQNDPCPLVYRGDPLEIVEAMAEEMGELTPRDAIDLLVSELAFNRNISIEIHGDTSPLPDKALAEMFVFALLAVGIAKPLPQA